MGTHLAGKAGNVYVADLLVDDCEDDWAVTGAAKADSAAKDTDCKVGDYSVKIVCTSGVSNIGVLAHEVMAVERNLTGYTHLFYWIKSSEIIGTAGDLEVGLSETVEMGGTPIWSDVPVLAANAWTYCFSAITPGTDLAAADNCGVNLTASDPGDFNVFIDDIRAGKAVAGMRSWSLDYTFDVVDVTDFTDDGARNFMPGTSSWSGTFEGVKDSLPLTIGTRCGIDLAESATVTQMWRGVAILTGVHPNVDYDGTVTYSYDLQGIGDLTTASA